MPHHGLYIGVFRVPILGAEAANGDKSTSQLRPQLRLDKNPIKPVAHVSKVYGLKEADASLGLLEHYYPQRMKSV